jgi:GNAT superfamily N-acetyltransferase
MTLRRATSETIDAFIAEAARHFFSGSEEGARANIGPFDETETSFLLAYEKDDPIATVTLRWKSNYPPFRDAGIPFIQNIEIRYDLRGQGWGGQVLAAVERLASQRSNTIGICVGLTDAYGPAQRLYAKCGYIPDGRGACHRFTPLTQGQTLTLNDDHLIWLTKDLSNR